MVYKDSDSAFKNRSPAGSVSQKPATGNFTDLILLSGVLLVMLLFVYLPHINDGVIRFVLALAVVLFVPGYMLIAAVYPGKDSLGNMERLLLAVTFSVILVPMACLVLNYTIWGIRLDPVIVVITLMTGFFTIVAFLRRLALPADRRLSFSLDWLYGDARKLLLPSSKSSLDVFILVVLLLSIVSVAAMVAYSVMGNRPADRYTELFLCDNNGSMGIYPTVLWPGQNYSVVAGISNYEGGDRVYDLVVNFDDGKAPFDFYRERIPVRDNQAVKRTIFLRPTRPWDDARVTFSLYNADDNQTPYRQCYLLLKNATAHATVTPAFANGTDNTTLTLAKFNSTGR